jgi:hypothetical protein
MTKKEIEDLVDEYQRLYQAYIHIGEQQAKMVRRMEKINWQYEQIAKKFGLEIIKI